MESVVNEVFGFLDFLEAWDQKDFPANKTPVSASKSINGKINNTGQCNDYSSPMLTRWHPQFQSLLEPGIKLLAMEIIDGFKWITFSSCEGHYHPQDDIIDNRHLAIVARNEKEQSRMLSVLEKITRLANQHILGGYIKITLLPVLLESNGCVFKGTRIFFEKKEDAKVEQYFSHLDAFTNNFVACLKAYRVCSF